MIYIASDHAGFELKRELTNLFKEENIPFNDLGPNVVKQDDDYPDFALSLAQKVVKSKGDLGILTCRNGIGMTIAANKVKGARAGLCTHVGQAVTARAHDDCNILVLAADFIDLEQNIAIVKTFLEGEFSGEERHIRRLGKIADYENKHK